MTPMERLARYFELNRRQSKLTIDEYHELLHLEEALVDDMVELMILQKESRD